MTVSEVLKNVDTSLAHFAIFESIHSSKSMYENIDAVTERGRIIHPEFPCTLEELGDREVCDIFPDYCPELCRYDDDPSITGIDIEDIIEPVLVIIVRGGDK